MGNKIEAKLTAPPSKQNLRRDAITELVLENGSVRIDTLVDELDVSRMTIHRDLDALEARGVLRKSRGFVTAVASSLFEASTDYRLRQQSAEKRAIAKLAFDLIEPGEAIVLDDSTTGLNLAELLPQKEPLTVITNFGRVLDMLSGKRGISLISTGGEYYQLCDAYKGNLALSALNQLSADTYFMSTPAVSNGVCFHQQPELIQVKRAMFQCAKKRVLIADHTKFSKRALYSMMPIHEFDVVISDATLSHEHMTEIRRSGVQLIIAKTPPGKTEIS
ncbi:DeoR faimly transcriptional regulator [Actinobaculum suis]|uniref:DeoR/GlpR family DNA-binding transcription regulator n=1 Tax=Actinobaculum suis TaxID=1657 RepID=UPI00066FB924|nr:DeoR/GlpR family DNA-binding transcription regulator [Actinobaculum suis]KMY22622.1 DeoR faimly transcriptional regulator [Actinobaculum suis]